MAWEWQQERAAARRRQQAEESMRAVLPHAAALDELSVETEELWTRVADLSATLLSVSRGQLAPAIPPLCRGLKSVIEAAHRLRLTGRAALRKTPPSALYEAVAEMIRRAETAAYVRGLCESTARELCRIRRLERSRGTYPEVHSCE